MAKYLYNGYELPELPSWNRQLYPYAVVLKFHNTSYGDTTLADYFKLFALDKKGYAGSGTWYTDGNYLDAYSGIILAPSYDVFSDGASEAAHFHYDTWIAYQPSETWELNYTNEENHYIGLSEKEKIASGEVFEIIWSNYDILDESGNVYLEGSDPSEPSDPLKDWLIGLAFILASETRPINIKDVFDDEWPIEWKYPDIEWNATKTKDSFKISNIVIPESDYEKLVLNITKNGVTTTYRYSKATQYSDRDHIELLNIEDELDGVTLINSKKKGYFPKAGLFAVKRDPCECKLYLAEEPSVPEEPTGDILDNEWPITWKMSEVEGNTSFEMSIGDYVVPARKVSDIDITDDFPNAILEVTATVGADRTTVQCVNSGGSYIAVFGDIWFSVLGGYLPAGEQDGLTVPESGLYFAIMDLDTYAEPSAEYDLQFTLTKGGA